MVAEEFFVNCYNFNPFFKSKKVIFKVSYKKNLEPGLVPELKIKLEPEMNRICGSVEPESKGIISAPNVRNFYSCKKSFCSIFFQNCNTLFWTSMKDL